MMSRLSGPHGPLLVFAVAVVAAMIASPSPANAGHHGTKYDVVRGYIIQEASVPAQATASGVYAAPSVASPQSQGLTVGTPQAPAPQLTVAPQPQATPAPVALQAAPVTYVPMAQLATAPAPMQVQLATAPAPVSTVSLAPTTQVQFVTLQAAPVQAVSLAAQPRLATQAVQVLTPVQLLIPHQHRCHFFGK